MGPNTGLARFQIKILFRDGKQFTGLMDRQARCKEALYTHIDASLTALNLIKLEGRPDKDKDRPTFRSLCGAVKNAMKI